MKRYKHSILKKRHWQILCLYIGIIFGLFSSCTDTFDLKLNKKNAQKLVIEGWITDRPGPYLVRLTMSAPGLGSQQENFSGAKYSTEMEAVKDALVIISDNVGTVDTLKPRLPFYSPDEFTEYFTIADGYYETNKLEGKPGRSYFLEVKVQDKEYKASSYMPFVTAIDSVSYIVKKNPFKENETNTVPTITFHEPQDTRDYYLFSQGGGDEWHPFFFGGGSRYWNVSVLSDELLPAYVKDYSIDDGVSPSDMDFYDYDFTFSGQKIRISMYSLTKEAFDYYKALISQFKNDGGAYEPAPASPPTNISNGAVGFFGASAVSYKVGKVQ